MSQKQQLKVNDLGSYEEEDRIKIKRKRINSQQLASLLAMFEKTDAPSFEVRDQLAQSLNMTNREVQVWFQNRRAKLNRKRVLVDKMVLNRDNTFSTNNFNIPNYNLGIKVSPSISARLGKRAPAPIKVVPYPSNDFDALNKYDTHRPSTAPIRYIASPVTPTSHLTGLLNHNLNISSPPMYWPRSAQSISFLDSNSKPNEAKSLGNNRRTLPSINTSIVTIAPSISDPWPSNNITGHNIGPKRVSAPSTLPSLKELGLIRPDLNSIPKIDNKLPPLTSNLLETSQDRNLPSTILSQFGVRKGSIPPNYYQHY